MSRRELCVRITLETPDNEDDSIELVDTERLHRALCTGFPLLSWSGVKVEKIEPAADHPLLPVLLKIADALAGVDEHLDAATHGDGFFVRS